MITPTLQCYTIRCRNITPIKNLSASRLMFEMISCLGLRVSPWLVIITLLKSTDSKRHVIFRWLMIKFYREKFKCSSGQEFIDSVMSCHHMMSFDSACDWLRLWFDLHSGHITFIQFIQYNIFVFMYHCDITKHIITPKSYSRWVGRQQVKILWSTSEITFTCNWTCRYFVLGRRVVFMNMIFLHNQMKNIFLHIYNICFRNPSLSLFELPWFLWVSIVCNEPHRTQRSKKRVLRLQNC